MNKSNLESLQYYSQFLKKLNTFKSNGKKMVIMEKIDNYLSDNIDNFYLENPLLSKDENGLRKEREK